jgi:hypothetical protein
MQHLISCTPNCGSTLVLLLIQCIGLNLYLNYAHANQFLLKKFQSLSNHG